MCRTRVWRHAFVLMAGMLFAFTAAAQSLDANKPAPLAPGVNKGNVDNIAGSHFYYFYAGPGHFDIKLAFKDLGLFGNPLRQPLDFDFYDDDGKLIAHNAIVAAGTLEHLTTTGDLNNRARIRLAVVPKPGAIRLGGYYEIEVTGAVELAGRAGATAGVTPVDNALIKKGGQTLVTPGQRLVNPAPPR
jgi:hypothetical protein